MLYQEIKIENGQMVVISSKEIDSNKLTSECWLIQFNGLKTCQKCDYLNKKECGGKRIHKRLLGK
jgi:hypothetical protein